VVKACRPRYRAACTKDDRGDAYLLADVLRTDGHRLRALDPQSDEIKALRSLVRSRDTLVAKRVALANHLGSLLGDFWPGAAHIFSAVDSQIALTFLARYPTPESASRLGEKQLGTFLTRHSYCGRRSPAELLERLRAAAVGKVGASETEAKGEVVRALVMVLRSLVEQIAKLSRRIERFVAQQETGKIFMSFPRAGRLNAAKLAAELGDQRERYPSEEQLAAEAGVAPVTRASGKQRIVVSRFACNHRLRQAVTTFADNSRHESAWAASIYRKARERGCEHNHAIRILARAWIRVLWRAWVDRKPYDVTHHRAAARLTAVA
jgi:transposase